MKRHEMNGLNMAAVQALRRDINYLATSGEEALASFNEMSTEEKLACAEAGEQLRHVIAQLEESARTLGALRGPMNKGPAMAAYNKAATVYNGVAAKLERVLQKLQEAEDGV